MSVIQATFLDAVKLKCLQDLGNTNYCVFVPRTQFERKTNALLVSDALNNLDINTYVNDRNDICIDGYKIGLLWQISCSLADESYDTSPARLSSWSRLERTIMVPCSSTQSCRISKAYCQMTRPEWFLEALNPCLRPSRTSYIGIRCLRMISSSML